MAGHTIPHGTGAGDLITISVMFLDIQRSNGRMENVWVNDDNLASAVRRYAPPQRDQPEPQPRQQHYGRVGGLLAGILIIGILGALASTSAGTQSSGLPDPVRHRRGHLGLTRRPAAHRSL